MSADASELILLRQAIDLSHRARTLGQSPFGAVIGHLSARTEIPAHNTEFGPPRDPTAHAEMNAVRMAAGQLSWAQMRESTLYTSCEPCMMCAGGIAWSGIGRVVFGLSLERLAELADPRYGFTCLIPCREAFDRSGLDVEVDGPLLEDEAADAHVGYWTAQRLMSRRRGQAGTLREAPRYQ